jgi:DNA-binding GntR family transcriptional regulator
MVGGMPVMGETLRLVEIAELLGVSRNVVASGVDAPG